MVLIVWEINHVICISASFWLLWPPGGIYIRAQQRKVSVNTWTWKWASYSPQERAHYVIWKMKCKRQAQITLSTTSLFAQKRKQKYKRSVWDTILAVGNALALLFSYKYEFHQAPRRLLSMCLSESGVCCVRKKQETFCMIPFLYRQAKPVHNFNYEARELSMILKRSFRVKYSWCGFLL